MTEIAVDTILDAAHDQFLRTGVRRTSGDDIARRAGVNRATLYRRVGTKEEIVRATFVRETQKVLEVIEKAIGEVPSPGEAGFDPVRYVETFFTVTISQLRENALLQQLLEIDREDTLLALTLGAGDAIMLSSTLASDRMRKLRAYVGNTEVADITDLAATFARIAQSLVLTPDAPPLLDTEKRMRAYARTVIAPMVLGRSEPAR